MSFFNIGIGIVIGIFTAIFFFIITKKKQETNSTPAIRTCGFGYTINEYGSECIENVPNIPTICPDFEGSSYEKHNDGLCYIKCLPREYQREFICEKTEGGESRTRHRYTATCPPGWSLDEGEGNLYSDNTCKREKKTMMPNYSCLDNQTLVDGKCYYFDLHNK
jgi:hypothetical protein